MTEKKFRDLVLNKIDLDWSNNQVEELDSSVQLSVITKAPEKYVLIDRETGQVYVGSNQSNPHIPTVSMWIEQK